MQSSYIKEVSMSSRFILKASRMFGPDLEGYTKTLEDAGCEFFTGACCINIPAKEAKKLLGGKVQVSDHVKHCYYAPTFMGEIGLKTILKPTEECVQAALSGTV